MKTLSKHLISLIAASLLLGCSNEPKTAESKTTPISNAKPIVVASKIDTEGGLLGNLMLLTLESKGLAVTNKVAFGVTPIVRKALLAGEVDIIADYTGNGAFLFAGLEQHPDWKNLDKGWALVKKQDYAANKVVWLTPSPANNTYALAVREDVATQYQLKTMSDFGAWVSKGGPVKLIASQEFVNFGGALPEFEKNYAFKMQPNQMVVVAGGDTANTIKAAAQQISGVNTAMVYGTDGGIAASKLVALTDDKNTQHVYAPAPIVREEVLKLHPEIETALAPVFQSLTVEVLRELNARIQLGGESAHDVAHAYLLEKGFISK